MSDTNSIRVWADVRTYNGRAWNVRVHRDNICFIETAIYGTRAEAQEQAEALVRRAAEQMHAFDRFTVEA